MDLSYLWLLPIVVALIIIAGISTGSLSRALFIVLSAIIFVALCEFCLNNFVEANAQIEVSASVPLTEENAYSTCLSECRFNYLK